MNVIIPVEAVFQVAYIDSQNEHLIEGYRAMAAEHDREEAAEEWSEALIGDISEAP